MDKSLYTIAFDLGGVVFDASNDTNIFSKNYLNTPLVEGIYDLIIYLSKKENYKLIIISKAYPNNAQKSKEILKIYGLDDIFNSIIFCEDKNDKVKIALAMNINVMIDDRKDILETFNGTNIKTILFTKDVIITNYIIFKTFSIILY